MNDSSDKEEMQMEEKVEAFKNVASASKELLQKKLENYLLLFYQGYLKGETDIVPEIRTAFFHLVKQDTALAFKVRMLQLDYLNLENMELEGAWDEAAEELFPQVDAVDTPLEEGRKKTLEAYKDTILEMLNSSRELRS